MKTETTKTTPSLRYDIILISALLLIASIILGVTLLSRTDGAYVEIEQPGVPTVSYPLSVNREYSLNGGTNILVIENGEAYLKDADCPDKTCVKTGRIRYVGQSIICLPNRISITVKGAVDDGVDIVS